MVKPNCLLVSFLGTFHIPCPDDGKIVLNGKIQGVFLEIEVKESSELWHESEKAEPQS